jgi:hypothetical protein
VFIRSIAIAALLCLTALPAQAQRTMSVLNSPTNFGGEDGLAFRIDTPGDGVEEFSFVDNANGLVEFYGYRVPPAPFELLGNQYLVPIKTADAQSVTVFAFIEDCGASQATYEGMFEITVPAGTYMTYRYDITDSCQPGFEERMYWADGVGLVRQGYYDDMGQFVDGWELTSVTFNGGTGLFPRADGNQWIFEEGSVPVEPTTVGTLKARFTD